MISYTLPLTCPTCAQPLEHRESAPISPDRGSAECWCESCLTIWRVEVAMVAVQHNHFTDDRRARAADALGEDVLAVLG